MTNRQEETLDILYQQLYQEVDAYRQLLVLAQQERVALQTHNLTRLQDTVAEKENLSLKLAKWERDRLTTTTSIANSFGLQPSATVTDLLSYVDTRMETKLGALRDEFVSLMEQLLLLNQGNQLMLKSGLDQVEATFQHITSVVTKPDGHYTANGQNHTQAHAGSGHVLNWQI